MTANSAVTVVIACHDYGRFLTEAVDSALGQSGGAPELVVVDDGSTDEATLGVLEELERRPVQVLRQPNLGVAAARNAGLEQATTPYVLMLDADDRLAPEALSLLRAVLDADEQLGFAYGHMRFFGDWEGVMRFPSYHPYRLLFRHIIGLSALARREVLVQAGGFDVDFPHYEDWELWVAALAQGWQGRQIDAVTLEYRRHVGAKQVDDRHAYRRAVRQLRRKHARLYADAGRLGRSLPLHERLTYRWVWGPRPVPARIERMLQSRVWRPGAG
jgi:glycosyltransferase involved in cell wall biosynthesis